MGGTLEVSLIVPVRSPQAEVREVVEALGGELARLGRSWECLLVFDGVRGEAWKAAEGLEARYPGQVRRIGLQQSFGESVCLSAGFESARGTLVLTSPPYVQVDPAALGPMLAEIEAGADLVAPWRHPRVDPWLNRAQSALFHWVLRRMMHVKFHDMNCYLRVMRRGVLEELVLYGDMYRFLPAIAFRQGFRVAEVKVRHLREWGGAGLFGLGVYARRLLDILGMMFLAKFTLRPLRFFGTLGGLVALAGTLLSGTIVVQHLVLGSGIWQRPLFMVGVLLGSLGVQIIGFGLVGEIIIYTQARHLREYRVESVHEAPQDGERSG